MDNDGISLSLRPRAPPPHLCRGGAHCPQSPMASSTAHPPTANSLRNCHRCCCCCPRCLSTLMLTLHPLAATASHDGHRSPCPCLPPCHRLMLTFHPTAATTLRDCLCPFLPPHHRSTLRVNVNVTSYCPHRHARSWSSSSSPSLSMPPVNVTHPHCILPPPRPCAIVIVCDNKGPSFAWDCLM